VVSPVIVTRWRLNDRWSLNASFGLDQITSASTDSIDDDVSSASRVDQRAFTTIEAARTFANQTVGISAGFSNEYDYRSFMAGGGTLGPLPFRSIEARFTVYDRDDGLPGFAASIGFGWGL